MIKLVQLFNDDDFYKRLRVTSSKVNLNVEVNQIAANLYFSGVKTIRKDIVYLIDEQLVENYFDNLHQLSATNFLVFIFKTDNQIINNLRVEKLADYYLPYDYTQIQLFASLRIANKNLKGHVETFIPRKLVNTSVSEIEQLLNCVSQRVFWKNNAGMYIGCNGSFAADFNLSTAEDVIGKTDTDLLEEKAALDFSAYDIQILKTGEIIVDFEKEIEFKNGDRKWLKISKFPHKKEGVIIGIVGKYEVVNMENVSTNSIYSDQKLLEVLMKNLPDTIYIKDKDSKFVKINQAQTEMLGLQSPEDAIGKTDFDFFDHEMAKKSFTSEQQIIFDGLPQNKLENFCKPGGNDIWMKSLKVPLKNDKGQSVGTMGISHNVTDLINAKHQLIAERDMLQLLIDHIPSPIYFKDMNSVITRANKALIALLGESSFDRVVGKTDYDFYPFKEANEFRNDELKIFASGTSLLNKLESSSWKNEHIKWVSTTKIPIKNSKGVYQGLVGISYDITDQVLVKQRLENAIKKSDEANVAKSNFLSNMSHEIRTPMNGIIGMAELLKLSELDIEQKRIVDILIRSGNNLLDIINDILDLSKIESGKFELENTVFNVHELINDIVDLMSFSAHENHNKFDTKIDSNLPEKVVGDSLRIKQVLLNLVNNAIKFTRNGEVNIIVKYIGTSDAQHCIMFKVSDTGIGLDPNQIDKIFDSFTQADASTTRKYGGTGLGLAISDKLIKMMGGKLFVQSVKGEGATFYFEILLNKYKIKEHNFA